MRILRNGMNEYLYKYVNMSDVSTSDESLSQVEIQHRDESQRGLTESSPYIPTCVSLLLLIFNFPEGKGIKESESESESDLSAAGTSCCCFSGTWEKEEMSIGS